MFCTYAKSAELKEMHTKVNNNVGKYGWKGVKETPVQCSLLTKDLYFFQLAHVNCSIVLLG